MEVTKEKHAAQKENYFALAYMELFREHLARDPNLTLEKFNKYLAGLKSRADKAHKER